MAHGAKIPLRYLIPLHLKAASACRKSLIVAGLAFDAPGLGVMLVAEDNRAGILKFKNDVPLVFGTEGRQGKKRKKQQGDRSTHDHVL